MDGDISVIIPTYNERDCIEYTVNSVLREVSPLKEIIVVDDDSPDATWQLIEHIREKDSRVRLIRRLNKKGLTSAIQEGIINSTAELLLWLDADFFSLPHTLTGLLAQIDAYDILVASRYVEVGRDGRNERIRVIASRLFNRLARLILHTKTQDLTSGYIIAKREIFDNLKLKGIYGEYCIRFLYEAEKNNLRIKEVPYVCLSRQRGSSKTSGNPFIFIKHCLVYLFTVFQLRFLENGAQN